jgi:iron complex outermembrane receptor protein/outer membrane receptor for ferrienterochelin and colicins
MFKMLFLFAAVLTASIGYGQDVNTARLKLINKDTKSAVESAVATVQNTDIQATSDKDGRVELRSVPIGPQTIEVFAPGYENVEVKLNFPLDDPSERQVLMEVNFEAGEVTVSSTRTGRMIEAEPTRVEAIDEEEVDEKISMRPSNVSMVVHESTGVQVQQTSATSNTQSVRIQGLDGRYTQILKDGFPAYGGFSGSVSLLEIPPLDLKQVEIIKGPSATLYGAGAIAGVINFISKTPEERPATSLVINQTSALGTDFSIFTSRKLNRFGYSFLGSANYQREYDVKDDDFTELPRTRSFALNPRLFAYVNGKTSLNIGNAFSYQTRKGGDIVAIRSGASGIHQYFENNETLRNVTTINFDTSFDDGSRFVARQSIALFSRDLTLPNYRFKGNQINSYSDLAYFRSVSKHSLVFGANAVYDRFREDVAAPSALDRSERRTTFGGFVQDTVDLTEKLAFEAGLRVDHVNDYGTFALPRVSLLYRFSDRFTSRVSYGLGYKTPSVFTEDAEELLFRNVAGIGNTLKAERSQGGTVDLNYNGSVGEKIGFSINQMFFYTQITDPLVLEPAAGGVFRFRNETSSIISKGFETNAKFTYNIAKLFVGYTFTDAKAGYLAGNRRLTLLPRHKINSSLVFEKAESFKAGAEFYFGSRQVLDDRSLTPSTAEFGLFGEKTFGKFSLFINAENIFDERQGRYGPVVLGPHSDPTFAEIYTHLEGRVFNGGIKIRF